MAMPVPSSFHCKKKKNSPITLSVLCLFIASKYYPILLYIQVLFFLVFCLFVFSIPDLFLRNISTM